MHEEHENSMTRKDAYWKKQECEGKPGCQTKNMKDNDRKRGNMNNACKKMKAQE